MLNRAVNEGFSGGEKKRNEIFQMALLEPTLAILDETDSGLDIDALKVVSDGVNALRSPERAIIVVTHYQRLLNYIVPDYVHVLSGGRIVKSGGKELALELEQKGYGWLEAGVGAGDRRDMAQVAEKLQPWLAALDERPRGGSRWLQDLRDHAASRFVELGFPTVRDEEWRFTNVSPIASTEFKLAPRVEARRRGPRDVSLRRRAVPARRPQRPGRRLSCRGRPACRRA